MKDQYKRISKLMSLALRHRPATLGITVDEQGWTSTESLLAGLNKKRWKVDLELLTEIVETNEKKRFSFSEDKSQIKANQGHSIKVALDLEEKEPPHTLYHGTVGKFMQSIQSKGLIKGNRHHVHLSNDIETATKVGTRRGVPVILKIDTYWMVKDGHKFYLSDNGVWLTDHVPYKYITK